MLKFLVMLHDKINYGLRYMILDWHATYSKAQNTQSDIEDNITSFFRHPHHHNCDEAMAYNIVEANKKTINSRKYGFLYKKDCIGYFFT